MSELCKCGAPAVWEYLPGDDVACDNCVPRGCSCQLVLSENVEAIIEDGIITNVLEDYELMRDELGRAYPCVEWEIINGCC